MTATILNPRPISLYTPSDFSQLTPMSERQQWINWIAKPGKDGKTLKIPSRGLTPDGEPVPINAHEPGNWKGLAEALAHVGPESFSGVGYVTSIQDNVVGGDVDGCVHGGVIDPLVLEMLREFNTRTELSPSGNGVRFWFTVADKQALLPHLQHKRLRGLGPYEIEMYGYGQFLTVTGNIVLNFPMTVNDATAALEALYANHPHSHGIVQDVDWDDQPITTRSREEVLGLALRNEKFRTLHETGDAARAGVGLNQAGEADQSRAEFFYFSTLLKHAENDPRLTLDLYRRSALYRDKANDWRNGIPYDQYSVSRTLARQLAESPPHETPAKLSGLPDWPETPTPLGQVNVAVPHLTADMLPPTFAAYVIDEAERLNVYPEHIAVPLMTALSIVVGTRLAIRPKAKDAWYEHPNLWGCVVAPPGSRKSDAIRVGLAPLNLLVQEAQHAHQQAMTEYAPVAEAFKNRMDAYKGEHKNAIKKKDKERQAEIEQEWATLGSLNPPIERRYMTQDATPEALLELAAHNPRGLLVHRDELDGIFANLTKSGRENERSMYLEAWSGKEGFRADRLTRQAAPVEKLCLSVFGGTQPGVLMPHMQSAYGRNRSADGFMQRFQLAVISTSTPPYRNDDREPNTEAKKGVTETFKLIDRADFMAFGAFADDQMRFYMRFTPEAQQVFLDWLERNHHFVQQLNAEQDEPLGSHFAKYNKLVPALALLFYLVECASQPASVTTGPAVVSLSALTYALRWGDFLALHARAIYQLGRSQAVDEASIAARILDQFRQGAFKEGETVRNVARAFGRSEHEAKEAIGELEELGWLRVETVKAHKGRPSIRVRLHPKFAAEIDSHSRR